MKDPAAISRFLIPESQGLGALMLRASRLRALTHAVQSHLGTPLSAHCQVANIRDDVLVLQTDSAAWASRLRFLGPGLLAHLARAHGLGRLRTTKVLVRPTESTARATGHRQTRISSDSAALLRNVAQSTEHAALRQALLRLSRRTDQATSC